VARAGLACWLLLAVAGCGSFSEEAPIIGLAFSSDGRWLAVARADGCVDALAVVGPDRRSLRVGAAVDRIALTEDGSRLVAAGAGALTIWSVPTARPERQLGTGLGAPVSLKLSDAPDPFLLAAFEPDGDGDNLEIWRLSDGVLVGSLAGSAHATFTFADEAVLLLSELDRAYRVASFGGRTLRQATLPKPLAHTTFAADGAFLAGVVGAGSIEETVAIMSVADDAFLWQSAEPNRGTRQLLFLENPSRLVQLGQRVLVHDQADGKVLNSLPALADARLAVAAPDGSALAAVRGNGRLVLVSSEDGSERLLDGRAACAP
jgi:hypothetical protein